MSGNVTSNETNLFYNFNAETLASYVGAVAVFLCGVTVLIRAIARPRVVVNCWFCNTNSRVASGETNNWYCPHCEQYNGFLSDGDYNKDIPEQRHSRPENVFTYPSKLTSDSNGLCDECNNKQDLKIKHLAAFQPIIPSNYEEELKIYRNQLENAYRLCPTCERVVSETLERKKSLVLGIKLQQSDKKIKERRKYFNYPQQGVYQSSLTALAATLCMMSATSIPIFNKLDYPLLSLIQEQVAMNYQAILAASFLIQLLLTLSSARKLPLVVCGAHICIYYLLYQKASVGNHSYAMGALSVLTMVLTLCSKRNPKSTYVKIKKIDKSPIITKTVEMERTSSTPEVRSPVVKPAVDEVKIERTERQSSNKPPATTSPVTSIRQQQDDNSSVDSAFSTHDSVTQDSDSGRGDVDSLIQSLSEWDSRVVERRRTPSSRHEFQSRQYKPVLHPPRLVSSPKSVNESSWVAGGFWHNHQNEQEQLTSRPGSPNNSIYSHVSSPGSPNNSIYSHVSSPSSPNGSIYSHVSSPGSFELPRPATPSHYPVYIAYSPPNGFQQPFGFQPYMYPPPPAPVVNPMWNSALFRPIPSSSATTPSSASCSSASTCGSVRRRDRLSGVASDRFSDVEPELRLSFGEALWKNSSVILYTSAFYVAVFAVAVFVWLK